MAWLCEKKDCTGCTACVSVCPKHCLEMERDEAGFSHPAMKREADCVSCALCEKTCPVLCKRERSGVPETYAAYTRQDAVRKDSSSGGIFSELAMEILNAGGAVFGAAYDENFSVRHICAEDAAGLAKLRGAKYAQSELGDTFLRVKAELDRGREVLFSGTPCQVAGLKAVLRKDYANLTCVDFVCHGVPSPKAWRAYVEYRAREDNGGALPKAINLRSKKTGWSRYRYSNLFEYADGASHTVQSGESLYMKLFVGDYICRESCAHCRFKGYSRVSDVTLGDFWGIWNIAPEMDDDKGTSLLLVHSRRGRELLAAIGERIVLRRVTTEEASRENSALVRSSPAKENRETVLREVCGGNFEAASALFPKPQPPSLGQRIRRKVKNLIFRGK